ncbi:MAG: ABC transporter permease [Bacteroidetes bacterium]|nr:ABC transporter permease [Bacteroidota bacterium]
MLSVARYTIIENYRSRIFVSAIGLILIICVMAWFGNCINYNNTHSHLSIFSFGMNLTELLIIAVILFLPVNHLAMEYEKGTAPVLWAKVKKRSEYLTGKYTAFLITATSIAIIASIFLGVVAIISGISLEHTYFLGYFVLAQFLQAACILSLVFCVYSLTRNAILSSLMSLLIIYFGIFLDSAKGSIHTSTNLASKMIYGIVYYAMPQLSYFNFEHQIVYKQTISLTHLAVVCLYALVFSTVMIALANILFNKKEV